MQQRAAVRFRSSMARQATAGMLVLLSYVLATARAGAEPSAVEPVQEAQAPVYHVGETWTIAHGAEDDHPAHLTQWTVTAVTPEGTRLSAQRPGGAPVEVDYDAMGRQTSSDDITYVPCLDIVKFPMSVGMHWQANYRIVSGKPVREVTADVSVEGAEVIHLPAGDVFAFRLVSHGLVAAVNGSKFSDSSKFDSEYWYAPSFKRVVKYEHTSYPVGAKKAGRHTQTFELQSYSPAPAPAGTDSESSTDPKQ